MNDLKHDDNYDLAVGGSRQYILNSNSYSPSGIFCFDSDENIASFQPRLLIRKDFAKKMKVNEIVQNAFEGGLVVKWSNDILRRRKPIIPPEPPIGITLKFFSPVLIFVLLMGSIMSTASFLCERIIHHKLKQCPQSWIWLRLEEFFDGERHYLRNISNY